jgi:hypothetical protein
MKKTKKMAELAKKRLNQVQGFWTVSILLTVLGLNPIKSMAQLHSPVQKSNAELILQYQSSWWDSSEDNASPAVTAAKRLKNTASQNLNEADRILQEVQFRTSEILSDREHAENWNLQSLPRYQNQNTGKLTKDDERYISKRMLKYLEKRYLDPIRQEAQNDKKQNKHVSSGKVMAYQALNPSSALNFGKDYRIKVKAKPLRGRVYTDLINPFLEVQLETAINGRAILHLKKDVSILGISTFVDYHFQNSETVAIVRKPLTPYMNAELSSRKLPGLSDQRLALNYGVSF